MPVVSRCVSPCRTHETCADLSPTISGKFLDKGTNLVCHITVWLPRFLIVQARCEVLPLTPTTLVVTVSTKYGPDREPVGLGVALS